MYSQVYLRATDMYKSSFKITLPYIGHIVRMLFKGKYCRILRVLRTYNMWREYIIRC